MLISFAEHLKPIRSLSRPHKGIVVDNQDPEKLGRVKVQINGLLEGDMEKLPWVNTMFDPSRFSVPEVNDELYILFPFQSIYFPFAMGYWHSNSNTNEDLKNSYPDSFGVSKQGFILRYDKKEQLGDFVHPSGSVGKLTKEGSIEVELEKDLKFTLKGMMEVTATGDILFTTDGNFNQTVTGNLVVEGQGGVEITSPAMAKFEGVGGTMIGNAASVTQVNGSTVLLAGGGLPVATVTGQCIGSGNLGAPVISIIIQGSSKVFAAP